MRPLPLALVVVAAVLGAPARAALLPFQATLSFDLGGQPPGGIAVSGTGVAQVNGSGGGVHLGDLALGAGAVSGSDVRALLTVGQFPLVEAKLTASNLAGSFDDGGGALAGAMALAGSFRFCIQQTCDAPPVANLVVPLSVVGTPASATAVGGFNMTVIGAPWTTGTAAIGTITRMGFARGPASLASSTAQASGVVQLVTPIFISTNIGAFDIVPGFATLTLHFVPEPATFALLAAGIAGLAWRGTRSDRQTGSSSTSSSIDAR
jgi:hypothetical protein